MIVRFPSLVACALLACAAIASAEKPKPAPKPLTEAQVRQTLERLIIPKLEFRETSLRDALDFLSQEAKRLDPKGRGIPFLVRITPPPTGTVGVPGIPGLHSAPGTPIPPFDPAKTPLTVSLTEIPFIEALRYVTGLANLKFWIRPDGIHIVALHEPEPMFTRDFRIPADFYSSGEKQDALGRPDGGAILKKDPRQFLIDNGVHFPAGAAAILNDQATRLTVHTTKDQFELIAALLKPTKPVPIPGPEVPKTISPEARGDSPDYLRRKMQTIVLPAVTMTDVSLKDAIGTLRELSVRHDTRSPRSSRGVNIVLRRPEPEDPPGGAAAVPDLDALPADHRPSLHQTEPLITYTATKVPLLTAIEAVAKLGQHHVNVQTYAVCIQKAAPPETLITREFLVPPTGLPRAASSPAEALDRIGMAEQESAKKWLVSSGVTFNGEASAIYIARTRRVIVRDTEKRLQEIEKQNEAAWREYYAAEKAKKGKRR